MNSTSYRDDQNYFENKHNAQVKCVVEVAFFREKNLKL
jgi:hypothetical protein